MKFQRLLLLALAAGFVGAVAEDKSAAADGAAPRVPSYAVRRYEVAGSRALPQESIDRAMREATGDNLSVAQIRRALAKLQQAYRERGFPKAALTLARQPLTNGVALIQVVEGPSATSAQTQSTVVLPAFAPAYDFRHFEIHGNTTLSAEEIDHLLTPAAGANANLDQLEKALSRLRGAYRERGLSNASVTLPQQLLTDGTVIVKVDEGTTPEIEIAATPQTSTPPPPATPPAVRTFEVHRYEVTGNTLLQPEAIDRILNPSTGTNVSIAQIQKAVGELQLAYRERGFVTVAVSLPQQQLTNATVRVQVTEGVLTDIRVTGNRHFSSNNVMRALPGLQSAALWKDTILNSQNFQRELDVANANQDRQIYPVLSPGPEPATTALTLKVKDRLPLHGHLEVNNKSTPDTPLLRVDAAVQYNNLWQYEHSLGLQYNFTPQDMKLDNRLPRFFDQPLIASYSAFYRLPFNFGNDAEAYSKISSDFGYDQVTRQFNLPAPTGRPELTLYASRSDADTLTLVGPVTTITSSTLLDITSQFNQRDPSVSDDFGAKLALPLREFAGVRSSFVAGFDYKRYASESFSTNITVVSIYTTNNGPRELFAQRTVPLDSYSSVALHYLPLTLGWSATRPDKSGSTSFSLNQNIFLSALASARTNFQTLAGSTNAGGDYTTLNAVLTREQKLPKDWSFVLRTGGQWSSAPLISNEQFALGGTAGVRGYQDGENYGDTGWRVQFDLRAAPVTIGFFPTAGGDIPANLRCSWFMDYGETYLQDRAASPDNLIQQWGTGLGFYLTPGEHFDARLTLGWALLDTPRTQAGNLRAYFSVGYQF